MNDLLKEIFKTASPLTTTGIKVVGTETVTLFSAVDAEKDLVLYIEAKQPIPEFQGIFGIPQLKLFESLIGYDGYKEQAPKIDRFKRRVELANGDTQEMEVPRQMNFGNKRGGKGVFYFAHGKSVLGSDLPKVPFEVEIEPEKEIRKEFIKLASVYATPECKLFGVSLKELELRMTFGTEGAVTHHGEMVFAEGVRGVLNSTLTFDSSRFSSLLKLVGDRPCRIAFANRKLIRVMFETDLANYQFWLRGAVTGAAA